MRKVIYTELAPKAVGPYSQGIKTDSMLFTSGQIAIDPHSGNLVEGGIEDQTMQAMENLRAVLQAGGSDFHRVVKVTVFLADINDFARFNAVYAQYFPNDPPARSAFQVAALPLGARVEIEMIAQIGQV